MLEYRIAGNFGMVQIFAQFESMPLVRKLKLSKIYFGRTCQKKKSNECGRFKDGTLSFLYEASP